MRRRDCLERAQHLAAKEGCIVVLGNSQKEPGTWRYMRYYEWHHLPDTDGLFITYSVRFILPKGEVTKVYMARD
jgi:hypothetical protein